MALIYLADTITKLGPQASGSVVVSGSHGGLYPAYLAARAGASAVILNDAGVGKDGAGIASLAYLQALGIAAATVSHMSCRIGSTEDMRVRGVISYANALAEAAGVRRGEACMTAAARLEVAPRAAAIRPDEASERRECERSPGLRDLVLVDSASLVRPEDAGQLVVTGSHGGLIGGVPAKALAVDAFAAVFHDAGVGIDHAGIGRLPALDARGIAALTASAKSARIGDARSVHDEGTVSFANDTALRHGARVGEPVASVLARWRRLR